MDLQVQQRIKELAEEFGADKLVVILGAPDSESAELAAETVVLGDPAFAGPLAGVQLGLDVYHVLEDEIRSLIPEDVWDGQIGVMADVLDKEEIAGVVAAMRSQRPGAN